MAERRFINADEAISLLPEGDEIHTTIQKGMMFIGADWSREDIIDKIQKSERIEITGPRARAMGHGLALFGKNAQYQSDILFVETDKAKLDAFDPQEEWKHGSHQNSAVYYCRSAAGPRFCDNRWCGHSASSGNQRYGSNKE